jgi:4-amino-4-deoxy-L-arabinose transferase-like glycosyltransferase
MWFRQSDGDRSRLQESGLIAPAPSRAPLTRGQLTALGLILTVGLALRVLYLIHALHSPGYVWEDPDGYAQQALRLAGPDGWSWTFHAVTYLINGQRHALPPLYSVFLSFFALVPGFPVTALAAQVALAVGANWVVFALGRYLHSTRAGLLAAAGYALWVPNIFNVWSTSQESLYIPLILTAFLLLARAIDREPGVLGFGVSGAVFGLAALTRSMPMFFVLPAACLHVVLAQNRRRATPQGAALLAGFLLLTVPYSAALSRYRGQLTIIDTHGSIHVSRASGSTTPGLVETARGLFRAVVRAPSDFLGTSLMLARSLLHVNGGRILQIYVVARGKAAAIAWKVFVHLGTDALLIVSATLAALGATVCRERRLALMFLLWAAINIAIASAGGFGGARLRTPFEPLLLVLAAVVCAGGWRRPRPIPLTLAAAAAFVVAAAVLPQVPRSLRSWPDYGVIWPSIFSRQSGRFTGAAGLNVLASDGLASLTATPAGDSSPRLEVRVGGVHVRSVQLTAGEPSAIRAVWPAGGLAFVELDVTPPAGKEEIHVSVAGR